MTLVNTDGMALIGPGSEWLWTAVSGIVLAVTFVALYRQMRAQRSTNLFEQLAVLMREMGEESFRRDELRFLLDLQDAAPDAELPVSGSIILDWYERLGYLVARSDLSIDDVWHNHRWNIAFWWAVFEPGIDRVRAQYGSSVGEWFERLELELRTIDRPCLGRVLVLGPEDLAREKSTTIRALATVLRMGWEARGTLPPTTAVGRAVAAAGAAPAPSIAPAVGA